MGEKKKWREQALDKEYISCPRRNTWTGGIWEKFAEFSSLRKDDRIGIRFLSLMWKHSLGEPDLEEKGIASV